MPAEAQRAGDRSVRSWILGCENAAHDAPPCRPTGTCRRPAIRDAQPIYHPIPVTLRSFRGRDNSPVLGLSARPAALLYSTPRLRFPRARRAIRCAATLIAGSMTLPIFSACASESEPSKAVKPGCRRGAVDRFIAGDDPISGDLLLR